MVPSFHTDSTISNFLTPYEVLQPRETSPRFGLLRFRSPLLTESIFLSVPLGTEMFQFSRLATVNLWIQFTSVRESTDQLLFNGYP